MNRKYRFTVAVLCVIVVALAGCIPATPPGGGTPLGTAVAATPTRIVPVPPTTAAPPPMGITASPTTPSGATAVPVPPTTAAPPPMGITASPTMPSGATAVPVPPLTPPAPPVGTYLDDRSTAWSLMQSYANAINGREYLRAYSYWEPGAAGLQPYQQFAQGYADTQSVQITIGTVGGDAGAGQFYSVVPVVLVATMTNASTQTFAGCYVLHLSNPGIQGTPPFQGLAIKSAYVQPAASGANTQDLLAHACQATGVPQGEPPLPTPATPAAIDTSNYVDNRSTGVDVMRSLVNAINRHEYVRAYSYWEPGAAGLQPYAQFAQGYANTQSVELVTGTETTGAGAGQLYYRVPVALTSTDTSGAKTTFVGCYTLHLGSPSAQGVPPFQPLAIQSASVQQAAAGADISALLAQACPQQ